ncbi:MAG: hypothetical protein EBS05_24125 [Proteobacteria bacterium]|nr:hypothetical protein [Pseudomonadota bacterium]
MEAEHDGAYIQVRDFRASFFIDCPEKFWIADMAVSLSKRGFAISSVQTGPSARDVAIFTCQTESITIIRDQGQWILAGDQQELEQYDLVHAFDSERAFSDAVSCYLLAKLKPRK